MAAGPWGALAGGVIGLGTGLLQHYSDKDKLEADQKRVDEINRQNQLNADRQAYNSFPTQGMRIQSYRKGGRIKYTNPTPINKFERPVSILLAREPKPIIPTNPDVISIVTGKQIGRAHV